MGNKINPYYIPNKTQKSETTYSFKNNLFLIPSVLVFIISLSLIVILIKLKRIFYKLQVSQNNLNILEKEKQMLLLSNSTKDEFLYVIAHDLKSPLNALSMMISTDGSKKKSKLNSTYLTDIEHDINSINHLLNCLLHWALEKKNNIESKLSLLNIIDLIAENLSAVRSFARQKNISFRISCLIKNDIYIDKEITSLIIRNLLFNAIKFSYPEGIIKVACFLEDSNIIISITDYGKGMDSDAKLKIFTEKTYQYQSSPMKDGTGIGLLMCKDFAAKIDAELKVESEINVGSTFSLILPNYSMLSKISYR
ncbi:sensor histidine kinase [Maribacter sp. 2-571]|uniref:sensor histidine kinase n=1 Tax=Maribacter sp. 2-571 TaxID=3417569 RepID=UPI003D3527F5